MLNCAGTTISLNSELAIRKADHIPYVIGRQFFLLPLYLLSLSAPPSFYDRAMLIQILTLFLHVLYATKSLEESD